MGKVTVKPIVFGSWGNCVHVSNGTVELVCTIDFGPRIIHFGMVGKPNLFFEDTERRVVQQGDAFAPVGGGAWNIYGGHRLWTSPEVAPRTTYPDNEPVKWQAADNGVVLTPPEERWNQLQKEIAITLESDGGKVTVGHRIVNTGPWAVRFAPWALSVMAAGGTAIVPQTTRETGLLPNRTLSLWPYSKMNDPRVTWGERLILLRQDPQMPPFKIGTTNEPGWAAYFNDGYLFVKHYRHQTGGDYPDYGVSFETYTNGLFLELETLGVLASVEPGEAVSHQEEWQLFADVSLPLDDEQALERELVRYIHK